jgi:5,10-methylene-tetrahydrofolate dehydrogenase/methenyl tetrahydrofolate cyclohydrolase
MGGGGDILSAIGGVEAPIQVKTALVSVYYKDGLEDLARLFIEKGVHVLSTGGTAKKMRELGCSVQDVADYTGSPEILDGRVKTLHPKIHGGILNVRGYHQHEEECARHGIRIIDVVVANLYPFELALQQNLGHASAIENIDIGGPCMVRASAKSHQGCAILSDPSQYAAFIQEVRGTGCTSPLLRRKLAAEAFARTADYDAKIARYWSSTFIWPTEASAETTKPMPPPTVTAYPTNTPQLAEVMSGKDISTAVRAELKAEGEKLVKEKGVQPGVAVILVGNRPDSATYVRNKKKAVEDVGFKGIEKLFPAEATEAEVIACVEELNRDATCHGILVQLPLPAHMDEQKVLKTIVFEKDVDGFSAANLGNLALKGGDPSAMACTPLGCMEILKRSGVEISGTHAVVIGRSNIVGTPVALMLMHANATVTICHSRTKDIPAEVKRADIVIAALGKANFVKGDWLKPGAVVVDVGINQIDDPTTKTGKRLVGDCEYQSCSKVASKITPVPGGVGPMTITMLLNNTLRLAQRSC